MHGSESCFSNKKCNIKLVTSLWQASDDNLQTGQYLPFAKTFSWQIFFSFSSRCLFSSSVPVVQLAASQACLVANWWGLTETCPQLPPVFHNIHTLFFNVSTKKSQAGQGKKQGWTRTCTSWPICIHTPTKARATTVTRTCMHRQIDRVLTRSWRWEVPVGKATFRNILPNLHCSWLHRSLQGEEMGKQVPVGVCACVCISKWCHNLGGNMYVSSISTEQTASVRTKDCQCIF